MAQDRTIHTKPLGDNKFRDLQVYYEKGGINYWDASQKPKGIYFATHCYTRVGGMTSWTTGQKGDGYVLAVPLERFSAKQLRLVGERVAQEADRIHAMFEGDGDTLGALQQYLRGEAALPEVSAADDREAA